MGSPTPCGNWQQANRPGEEDGGGGAGTACGQCIFPALNDAGMDPGTGATIRSSVHFGYNIGACIAVEDPTNGGSACELAEQNLSSCERFACQTCTGANLTLCEEYAPPGDGVCGTEAAAVNSSFRRFTPPDTNSARGLDPTVHPALENCKPRNVVSKRFGRVEGRKVGHDARSHEGFGRTGGRGSNRR